VPAERPSRNGITYAHEVSSNTDLSDGPICADDVLSGLDFRAPYDSSPAEGRTSTCPLRIDMPHRSGSRERPINNADRLLTAVAVTPSILERADENEEAENRSQLSKGFDESRHAVAEWPAGENRKHQDRNGRPDHHAHLQSLRAPTYRSFPERNLYSSGCIPGSMAVRADVLLSLPVNPIGAGDDHGTSNGLIACATKLHISPCCVSASGERNASTPARDVGDHLNNLPGIRLGKGGFDHCTGFREALAQDPDTRDARKPRPHQCEV